jgi:hypothetical protein
MRYDPFDKYQRYQNNQISKLEIRFRPPLNVNPVQLQLTVFSQNVLAGKTVISKPMHDHRYIRGG